MVAAAIHETAPDPAQPDPITGARIEIRDVSHRFELDGTALPVLDQVSLSIEPGEFVALLGPSGCGKSTTLWSIAGLHRPDSGTITFGDRVVFDSGRVNVEPEHRNCGVVFQSYAIWPHMDVFGNAAFPLQVGKRRFARLTL